MDTGTEICKHLDNQTVAWERIHGFRDNPLMKCSNEILGGCDLYSGRVSVIKGSAFVNSRVRMSESGTTRVEVGSNTSTVTLRVVGGDDREVSNLRE
jgi:hypothetical protein